MSGSRPSTATRWRRITGSLSKLGTSISVDSPCTTAEHVRRFVPPVASPFGSRATRMAVEATSADVLQVQTSSRAGSAPNAMATWSGTVRETTCVFQTRPVASSVECRRRGPAESRRCHPDPEVTPETAYAHHGPRCASVRRGQPPRVRLLVSSVTSELGEVGLSPVAMRDKNDIMGDRRTVETVDSQSDRFPRQTLCDRRSTRCRNS